MKKKGFTLVELLAVVVVLSVIALVAVPLVTNQMEDTKEETYRASVRNVFDAVTSYLAQNPTMDDIPSSGVLVPDSEIYKQLDLKNEPFTGGWIYRDKDGIMKVQSITDGTYCASGSKNNLEIVKGTCDLLDVTEPEIHVYVSSVTSGSILVIVDSTDGESGLTSYEYYLNGKLQSKNQNNVYNFSGLEANKEYEIEVKSINGNGQAASDKVTVSTASADLKWAETPEGWSHSKTVTITYPRVTGTEVYKYKIVGTTEWVPVSETTVDIRIEQDATITAQVYRDGKLVSDSTKTFGKIDNKAPTIQAIEGNTDEWKTSKQITIRAVDNESGLAEQAYSFDGGKTWQSSPSKTFTSMDTVYILVKDKLDNISDAKVVTIKKIDPTIPKTHAITATAGDKAYTSGTWTNKNVTLKANPNPGTTLSGYTYQWYKKSGSTYSAIPGATGQTYVIGTEGQGTYRLEIKTGAGGGPTVSSNTFTVKIDKTAPGCSWSGESTKWIKTSRTIKNTCTDSASKCVDTTAKEWVFSTTTKTSSVARTVKDNAGNSTLCQRTANVYVDKTAPKISVTGTTSSTKAIGINFSATDDHSGINASSYSCMVGTQNSKGVINYNLTGTIKNGSCTATGLKANTTYYYKITVKDKVGNTSDTATGSVQTKKFSSITINVTPSGWQKTKELEIIGKTDGAQLQYQINSTNSDGWKNIDSGFTETLDENCWIYVRFTDGTNVSTTASKQVTQIDSSTPIVSISGKTSDKTAIGSNTWTTKNVTLTANASGSASGYKSYQWYKLTYISSGKGSQWVAIPKATSSTYTVSSEGTGTYSVKVTNNAGTTSEYASSFVVRIDKTKPTVSYNKSGGTYTGSQTVKVTGSDSNFSYMMVHVYKDGSKVDSKSTDYTTSKEYTVKLDSTGTWNVYTIVVDAAGNQQNQTPDNGWGWYYQEYIIKSSSTSSTTPTTPTPDPEPTTCDWYMTPDTNTSIRVQISGATGGSGTTSGTVSSGTSGVQYTDMNTITFNFSPSKGCAFSEITYDNLTCKRSNGSSCTDLVSIEKVSDTQFRLKGTYGISCDWTITAHFVSKFTNGSSLGIVYKVSSAGIFDLAAATTAKWQFSESLKSFCSSKFK